MARIISLDEAYGATPEAVPGEAPAAAKPTGRIRSLDEAYGAVEPTSVGGFLKNPQSWKDMAGYAAGAGAQLSDMFTGIGKSLLGGGAYLIERGDTKGAAVKQAPVAAYDGRLPPKGEPDAKGRSAAKAQATKDQFPAELAAPWAKVAEAMGPEAQAAYNENGIGWIMGKVSELIEHGGKKAQASWGVPASDLVNAVDMFTGVLGAKALKPQAQAMLRARMGELTSDVKAAKESRPLTPEELAQAQVGAWEKGGGYPGEPMGPAKPVGKPTPVVPEATAPAAEASPAAPATLSETLDPYKIPAVVAGTGAAAWAMQNQLSDDQLAGLGIAGAAAMVKLHGVPEPRLIDMLKEGGPSREAAAAQIYRDNVPMLTRSLQKYAKQGVEIEDVVQRTMEKGMRAIEKGQFSGDSAIGTYLYRIADNEAKSGLRYEKVRPRTESLDNTETPGAAKGDDSLPSPHENVADTSLAGRSPEQVALNNALGERMAKALDKLPENFRRPFELSELEGLSDAEIAAQLGQPIGTVKSQISRAKEQLRAALREYGPKGAAAGAGAVVLANMDPKDREALGLGMAMALGAIKDKGGMWHPHAAKGLSGPLEAAISHVDRFGVPAAALRSPGEPLHPGEIWAKKVTEGYLNKHAGTATDPLKDITLPDGTRWEDAMDQVIGSRPASDYGPKGSQGAIKGLRKLMAEGKVSPDEPIYQIASENWPKQYGHQGEQVGTAVLKVQDYLAHVGDYMHLEVPVDKWAQYDLVRAVKETKAWDDRMAKEAVKATEREGNAALQRMKTMTVVQEFPGGLKLVKLDRPGDFAHESTVMGHSVRGYEPHGKQYPDGHVKDVPENGAHPDWVPESEKGMTEARFSSGHPEYGLGGWDAIKRGDAEILSLRDAKGQSHVTIEIDALDGTVQQIRGKGNAPVPERYQQAIADFLNSREWKRVGDLDNAGIVQVYNTYMTERDVRPLLKRTVARLAKQDGYTPEQLDQQLKQIDEMDTRGVQWAVNRRIQDLEHTLRMERVAAKRGEKLETPEAYNPRDVFRNQRGRASPEQIFTLAAITGGASLSAFLNEDNPLKAAFYGALAGGFLGSSKGRAVLKQAIKKPDVFLGLISTRLGNIAPSLKGRIRLHELRVLKALSTTHDQVTPFLRALKKQSEGTQTLIARDLLNGRLDTLNKIPELAKTYPAVKATLKAIEGQLVALGRFGEGVGEYFPRIIKDYDGLKEALSQPVREGLDKTLAEAEAAMMRKKQRALTEVERSVVANRYLFAPDQGSFQPGYAHARRIKEVTEKLQPFYEKPAESLLRYVSGAITDVETARFFGRDLKVNAKGEKKFTNLDESIGNLTASLLDQKKITPKQAMEVRDILRARFGPGDKAMNPTLGMVRDITNAGLLGNVVSAATQLGDSFLTVYHFGLVPTLQALTEKLIGSEKVTPKQLGLVNHLAEELSGGHIAGKVLQNSLKYTGFAAIDLFAKGLGINAALIKAQRMARTPGGRAKLAERYGYAFENDLPQLIQDLSTRANTPRTQRLAFEALSDIQPISRAELPQAYLEHPNGRLLYQLKTYMLKQGDVVRRDAYDKIATGKPADIMRGVKNLAALATVYAVANVPGDVIKDWLSGRNSDPLSTPKLVENVLQTFGLNRYATERLGQGKVVDTLIGAATPPLKVIEDIAAGRDKAISYIPGVGRIIYDRYLGGNEKREISEKRSANRGLPKGEGQELSDEAKAYLERLREERKAKAENQ
jgi:RNA polymerase sigma-70 factor (ECF subfamily)